MSMADRMPVELEAGLLVEVAWVSQAIIGYCIRTTPKPVCALGSVICTRCIVDSACFFFLVEVAKNLRYTNKC